MLCALWACSRVDEQPAGGMDPSLEGKPVEITFSLPDVLLAPSAKSLSTGDGQINGDPYLDPDKLYLVVCGHSQSIKYIRKAEPVIDPATGDILKTQVPVEDIPNYPITDGQGVTSVTVYTFRVQLELSDSDRTVHFLGNIDENQLITGSYAYQILPSMLSYEGKQAYWQKVYLEHIHPKLDGNDQPVIQNGFYVPDDYAVGRLEYVPLIRNYAKILVTDATDPDDGFELFSYAVIYYPQRGSVVPYRSNASDYKEAFNFNTDASSRLSGYESCNFPTLDETLRYQGNLPPGVEFDYSIPDAYLFEHPEESGGRVIKYDKNGPEQGVYLYERGIPNATMDPTYVIIRGRFGKSEYYEYRLDLMETKMVNFESVYQYYPIYRNFRYNIQLNRISSMGVSTPEAAANSSGAEDISADISMRYLSDISNGQTRLVVEPFMSKTYTGPSESGYYYLYARFFNDLNSSVPNLEWGAVTVELEPMEDLSDDILVLYDDQGHEVHGGGFFYPMSQTLGSDPGFRIIRFNTKDAVGETKTQKIKITGRNQNTFEEFPLYREVEISLQNRQTLTVECETPELSLQRGAKQTLKITIPAGLPSSMFPLEFIIEAEDKTLTPDNDVTGNNLPVRLGTSISDHEGYAGKHTFQFVRTLTIDEYNSLTVKEGMCSFYSYFKSNRSQSATTIWVGNDYFYKGSASFTNRNEVSGHFYVQSEDDEGCVVALNCSDLEYKVDDDGEWAAYTANKAISLDHYHKVYFRSTKTVLGWNGGNKFYCYKQGASNASSRNGIFSVGGNLASLLIGDDFESGGPGLNDGYTFTDFFKNHTYMTDASELILPMLTCKTNCYKSMFEGCANLKKGPVELPATKMADVCYRNMFKNCSSLEIAPILPAENIGSKCYQMIFNGCSSLKEIRMNSKTYVQNIFYSDNNLDKGNNFWAAGLPAEGTIYLNPAIKSSANYQKLIPEGWTVKRYDDGGDWE